MQHFHEYHTFITVTVRIVNIDLFTEARLLQTSNSCINTCIYKHCVCGGEVLKEVTCHVYSAVYYIWHESGAQLMCPYLQIKCAVVYLLQRAACANMYYRLLNRVFLPRPINYTHSWNISGYYLFVLCMYSFVCVCGIFHFSCMKLLISCQHLRLPVGQHLQSFP